MTSRYESKAFVVNAKQLAQADPGVFIDALAAGYGAPVCELCDDQGERLVPVGRDGFGNWDTVAVPCSCEAGRELAERLSSSSAAQGVGGWPAHRSKHAGAASGVSGSLVRGGDPDPSVDTNRKAA